MLYNYLKVALRAIHRHPVYALVGAIGLLTVSYHAIRAAWANPIDSLRYE